MKGMIQKRGKNFRLTLAENMSAPNLQRSQLGQLLNISNQSHNSSMDVHRTVRRLYNQPTSSNPKQRKVMQLNKLVVLQLGLQGPTSQVSSTL